MPVKNRFYMLGTRVWEWDPVIDGITIKSFRYHILYLTDARFICSVKCFRYHMLYLVEA